MFVYEAISVSVCERAMENPLGLPMRDLYASVVRYYKRFLVKPSFWLESKVENVLQSGNS